MNLAQVFSTSQSLDTYPTSVQNRSLAKFETELDLVSLFESIILDCFSTRETIKFLKEFDCGNGIADIVIFSLRKDWKSLRNIGQISPRWAFALECLEYRKIFNTDNFAQNVFTSKSRAKLALEEYVKGGYCVNKGDSRWKKIKQPRPIVNNIVAIEAKLTNWKRALIQAYRYQEFASQAWVLLDSNSINPALKNIYEFQRLNVGLSSLAKDRKLHTHFYPEKALPKSDYKIWYANSIIANRLTSSL